MSEEEKFQQEEEQEQKEQKSQTDEGLLSYFVDPTQDINLLVPQASKALMESSPEKLLDFVQGYDKRQVDLIKLQEENQHKEEEQRQANKKLSIIFGGLFACIVFVSSLVYAGVTKDNTLPKDLLNIFMASLGGSGITYGLTKKSKDSD